MSEEVKKKHPGGRPSKYNKTLAETICALISQGFPLNTILKQDGMPRMSTVMRWLFYTSPFQEEFREMYVKAREAQAEVMADQIISIADDDSEDVMFSEADTPEGKSAKRLQNKEFVNRSRLRVDARKWVAAKLLPRKYGDFERHEITVTKPLVVLTDDET